MNSKRHSEEKPKIGAGHAEAMLRQGLKELRGALYTDSNVAQPAEYGIYGTKTPGEVAQDRSVENNDPGGVDAFETRVKQAEQRLEASRDGRERDGPEPEKE